jgi:hypothetical protein
LTEISKVRSASWCPLSGGGPKSALRTFFAIVIDWT